MQYGLWKRWHTVWNPATQARNIMWNGMAIWANDVHLFDPRLNYKVGKGLLTKDSEIRKIVEDYGILDSTFTKDMEGYGKSVVEQFTHGRKSDSFDLFSTMAGAYKGVGKLPIHPAKIYQGNEVYFKALTIQDRLDKGWSIVDAVKDANRILYDYGDVSHALRMTKALPVAGSPFPTFWSKSPEMAVRTAITHPVRMSMLLGLPAALEYAAGKRYGPKPVKEARKAQADWVRSKSTALPFGGEAGVPRSIPFMDLTTLIPITAGTETINIANRQSPGNIGMCYLRTWLDVTSNRKFTGQDIYPGKPGKYNKVTLPYIADHVAKSMLPANMPPIGTVTTGGTSYNKRLSAKEKTLDYFNRMRTRPEAIAETIFGLRVSRGDPEITMSTEMSKDKRRIGELKSAIKWNLTSPSKNSVEKDFNDKQFWNELTLIMEKYEKDPEKLERFKAAIKKQTQKRKRAKKP